MDRLLETDAFDGLLPVEVGGVTLRVVDLGVITSLSVLGDVEPLAAALAQHHGVEMPQPGRATGTDGARCIWFGLRDVLLCGPAPDAALGDTAAVVDVSDGWAALRIDGAGAVEVLARLVPLDLREATFKRGHTARTQVGHMAASITRLGDGGLLVLVFRSMAGTLVTELRHALEAVAARR